ncbi:hypothetical protein DHODJN_18175 [Methylorubrum extorquens]
MLITPTVVVAARGRTTSSCYHKPDTGECRPRMESARAVSIVRAESRSVSQDATSLCDTRGLRFGHGAISARDFRHLAMAGIATKFERRSPHRGQVGFVSGSGPSAIRMRMSVDGAKPNKTGANS